jgi:hypothetical protein
MPYCRKQLYAMVIEIKSVMHRLKLPMLVFTIGVDKLYQESIQFYFQKILRIRKSKKWKNIALNTLGTIIHETLKSLYDPFCWEIYFRIRSKLLQTNRCWNSSKWFIKKEIKKGRNLLTFEVLKRNVSNSWR